MSDTQSAGAQPPKSPAKSSDPYKVYRQGFLLKCPPRAVRKKLHRYWFVLFKQKDMLAFIYFQDEDHYLERKKNEGFFRIDDLTSIDVIPEHMGRKNAFCIATPRAKYHLVSESRYELHHWLLALHGAIDDFKNSTAGRNSGSNTGSKKKAGRSRAHSTSTSPPASLTKNQTRIKPSRPAPRAPPKDKKKGDEENIPPHDDYQSTTTTTTTTSGSRTHDEDLPNLPSPTTNHLDDIVAGLLKDSHDVHTTLDYTLTEDEEYLPVMNGGNTGHEGTEETGSLSTSMPILNDKDNTTEESGGNSDENSSPPPAHTRHLSFSSSQEFPGRQDNKRRMSKKRSGSMKGRRSVSPPNLPPPPPPPTEELEQQNEEEYTGENVINSFEPQGNIKLSPKPPIPARTTSLNANQTNKVGTMDVNQYLDEAFNEEDYEIKQITTDNAERKSPGILRKAEQQQHKQPTNTTNTKRSVVFDEKSVRGSGGRYEPMVDHESLPVQPNIVASTKLKLFGTQESESFRYNRQQLQNQSNVPMEHQDELLEAIETALQPTSYMEQQPQTNTVGFSADVGPPSVPLPNRPPSLEYGSSGGRYSLETSPKEVSTHEPPPVWANPTFDDTPTTTTFASNQDTMYRSIV